jgi:colicin import membrane protein
MFDVPKSYCASRVPLLAWLQDVQLQNVNAWANLSQPQEGETNAADGAGVQAEPVPMEDDTLWTEFQGREAQQREAEEQKRKLEEEQRRKQEAEEEEARRAVEEARLQAQQQAEAAQKREQERLEREAAELQNLTDRGAEAAEAEMLRQVGHESQADLEELGLTARQDEDEEDDEVV